MGVHEKARLFDSSIVGTAQVGLESTHVGRTVARLAAAATVLASALALVGWEFGIEAFKSLGPSLTAMNPLGALAFILAGVSLWLQGPEEPGWKARRVGQVLASAVLLVGLLRLAEILFGWHLGIDRILFRGKLESTSAHFPNRIPPNAATSFFLIGSALLLLDVKFRRRRPAQILALVAGMITLLAVVGYAYGVQSFYGLASFMPLPLNAAMAFLVLCIGILFARPDAGLAPLFSSGTAGGIVARRLLPIAIALPILLGWLRVIGQRAGLFGTELGTALSAVTYIVVFAIIVYWNARLLHRTDFERTQAEAALQASQRRFAGILDIAEDAIISVDESQSIRLFNQGAEKIFGYAAQEILGQPLDLLIPARFVPAHRQHIHNFVGASERARRMGERTAVYGRRKDGSEFPAEASISKLLQSGQVIFTVMLRDISDRKHAEQEIVQRSAQLEAANKELEAFSYSVSHDLRAPLRGIDGFSLALLEDYGDKLDADGKDCLQRVRAATQRMGVLIDDLLNLSQMTRTEIKLQRADLSAIVRSIAAELQKNQPERQAEFRIEESLEAFIDPHLIRIALENLLDNAWKFTSKRESACIEFGKTRRDQSLTYFIRDDGAGFDPAYAGRLFGAFQRLHDTNDFPGTGVGLATVQRIIHRHGGRIWAESALERGATFYFTLLEARPGGG
jgi:PAS domain S-box-containing protein